MVMSTGRESSDEERLDSIAYHYSPESYPSVEDGVISKEEQQKQEGREAAEDDDPECRKKAARSRLKELFLPVVRELRRQGAYREAQVFDLCHIKQMRPWEIAKKLNLTSEAVRIALFRAREKADAILVSQHLQPIPRR